MVSRDNMDNMDTNTNASTSTEARTTMLSKFHSISQRLQDSVEGMTFQLLNVMKQEVWKRQQQQQHQHNDNDNASFESTSTSCLPDMNAFLAECMMDTQQQSQSHQQENDQELFCHDRFRQLQQQLKLCIPLEKE